MIVLINSDRKAFFFFMATNICLAVFVWLCLPETRRVALEEVDVLFGGQNHQEKGGNILDVADPHHAQLGVDNTQGGSDKIAPVVHHDETSEIR